MKIWIELTKNATIGGLLNFLTLSCKLLLAFSKRRDDVVMFEKTHICGVELMGQGIPPPYLCNYMIVRRIWAEEFKGVGAYDDLPYIKQLLRQQPVDHKSIRRISGAFFFTHSQRHKAAFY